MRAAIGAVLRRCRHLLAGYERRFLALGVVATVAGLLEALVLVIVVPLVQGIADEKHLIHVAVPGVDQTIQLRTLLAAGLVAVTARLLVQLVLARQRAGLQTAWDAALRRRVFHAYLGADWTVQSGQRATHVQETLTGHLAGAQVILSALTSGWIALFSLAVMLAAAIVVNLVGAVLIVAFGATMSLALRPLARRSRALAAQQTEASLTYVQEIGDAAALAREVRVFGAADVTRRRFDEQVDVIADLRRRTIVLGASVPAIYQNVVILVVLAGLALIYALVPAQLASLAVVVLVLIRASSYSQTVQVSYQQLNEAGPYFERVVGAEALFLAHPQRRGGDEVGALDEVRFERVGYRYPDLAADAPTPAAADIARGSEPADEDEAPQAEGALHGVDLALHRGTVVGVVGPSGAGKSTFVQLLLGLRDPTEGRVTADGVDVRELDADAWFARVSVVPQEPVLLATTVFDNIAFRREGVTAEQVEEAALRAHVHDEIVAFPEGYQTRVGERGGHVSGGQRQRICIARALVGDPHLVVFDEPTSALDPQSESRVQQALDELRERALVVVVAHRLSTLDRCDEIVVFRDGRLLAHGPAPEVRRSDPWVVEALALGAGDIGMLGDAP
jgi:ABC-type multidrug transport system fused ATPase/permease subunit